MARALPDRQRDPPFLQPRAEVLGPVDGIKHRNPARAGGGALLPAFLADKDQIRQSRAQIASQGVFQKHIRLGDRAAVGLPGDLVPQRLDLGQTGQDQVTHAGQQRGNISHLWRLLRSVPSLIRSRPGLSKHSPPASRAECCRRCRGRTGQAPAKDKLAVFLRISAVFNR